LQQEFYRTAQKNLFHSNGGAAAPLANSDSNLEWGRSDGAVLGKSRVRQTPMKGSDGGVCRRHRVVSKAILHANFIDHDLRHHHSSALGLIKGEIKTKLKTSINMKKSVTLIIVCAVCFAWSSLCSAQSDAPYTEGPVWQITMVKAKYGMGDEYLKGLAKTFKGTLDEAKKQDLIVDYKILLGDAATPHDFDILLMVESKNMAAFDNAREKFDPIARKIEGNPDQQRATATKRVEIREILGSKLMREVTLK
jgi:hypothetical protein